MCFWVLFLKIKHMIFYIYCLSQLFPGFALHYYMPYPVWCMCGLGMCSRLLWQLMPSLYCNMSIDTVAVIIEFSRHSIVVSLIYNFQILFFIVSIAPLIVSTISFLSNISFGILVLFSCVNILFEYGVVILHLIWVRENRYFLILLEVRKVFIFMWIIWIVGMKIIDIYWVEILLETGILSKFEKTIDFLVYFDGWIGVLCAWLNCQTIIYVGFLCVLWLRFETCIECCFWIVCGFCTIYGSSRMEVFSWCVSGTDGRRLAVVNTNYYVNIALPVIA